MKTLLLTILITFISQYSFAYELSDDEKLDIELGALDTPTSVKNNDDLIYLLQIRTREPIPRIPDLKPPFKQQPPGAQDDFREEEPPRPQSILGQSSSVLPNLVQEDLP